MGTLLLGAVAYDPRVVAIWAGFRAWFRGHDLDLDFVLYSNYERQVEALVDGQIDVAWNSPLAWVRARRLAQARGARVAAVTMRDTDRDLTSVVVTRAGSKLQSLDDLRNATIGTGAIDSPQATLLPLSMLRTHGVATAKIRRFDVGVGLHGDHVGGERQAAQALAAGSVDAACMTDANLLVFGKDGTLPSDGLRVLAATVAYDHCNMTAGPAADPALIERFTELLLGMSYADPDVRPLLDLEGLTRWVPGRTDGYAALEQAVNETAFYHEDGRIGALDYRP